MQDLKMKDHRNRIGKWRTGVVVELWLESIALTSLGGCRVAVTELVNWPLSSGLGSLVSLSSVVYAYVRRVQ